VGAPAGRCRSSAAVALKTTRRVPGPGVGQNACMESLRGQLLIASPKIVDPNFRRVVVYMAEHTEEGAMGLVLNRPAETTVTEAVPDLEWLAGEDDAAIWVGGPVSPASVIVLAEFDDPASAAMIVDGDLGFVPADIDDRDAFAAGVRRVRIFAGHAGWGPGQLESELEEDSWIIEPARRGDVFTAESQSLWSEVLRRKGRDYVLLATMPMDPSLN
jgi:putative transcriptional regulator